MNMKKRIIQSRMTAKAWMIALLLGVLGESYAYDFSAVCETGQTLYYSITDTTNHYVEMVAPNSFGYYYEGWDGYTKPSGNMVLDSIVTFENVDYTVTSIGYGAFSNCFNLTGNLIIPNSVITISDYAFNSCIRLTDLTIANSVLTIGVSAFSNCGFTSIIIPNSVTTIGGAAFSSCGGLSSLSIPNSVISIGSGVFNGTAWYNNQPNGILYLDGCCLGYKGNQPTGTLNLLDGTRLIADNAFVYCSGLIGNLSIPNSLSIIGKYAFQGCSGFTGDLIFGDSLTAIGDYAFQNCNHITSIAFSNLSTSIAIRQGAFNSCTISSVFLSNAVTEIEDYAFSWCGQLEQIIVDSENPVYDSRDGCNAVIETNTNRLVVGCKNTIIPNSVTTIGATSFYGNSLTSIVIPNSINSIEFDAFRNCRNLISVEIPNSVTFIGNYAFLQCNSLSTLSIGNSLCSIGKEAFCGCTGLSCITVFATIPPLLGYYAFSNVTKSIPVYVPYGSTAAYISAPGWNEFTNYHEMAYRTISGYVESDGLWQFIASPLVGNASPETVDNMMSATDYDLYQFNPTETEGQWQNFKADTFNLVNGQGYLYATEEEVNLIFKGEFNEDETKVVELVYDEGSPNAGWNLVGNPFPVSAYINRDYYVMNEDGTGINPVAVPASTPIPPCTGVMVKANGPNETVVFTRAVP